MQLIDDCGVQIVPIAAVCRGHVQIATRLVQNVDHWDVWIEIPSVKGRPHKRIVLLVRMSSLCHSNPKRGAGSLSDPWNARYRLTCI
jgi:hypothetical protein